MEKYTDESESNKQSASHHPKIVTMSGTLHRLKEAIHPKPHEYSGPAATQPSGAAPRTTHAVPGPVGDPAAGPDRAYASSRHHPTSNARPHDGYGAPAAAANLPGPAPTTAGPHRHDILNKLDPSVDSKGTGQTVPGGVARPPQPVAGLPGPASTTGGPHKSNLMNKLDPNVDSRTGAVQPMHGAAPRPTHASHHHQHAVGTAPVRGDVPEGTYGPHQSRIANALDPRVDSDRDDRTGGGAYGHTAAAGGRHHGGATGAAALPGPAPTTAGPHRSDLMNKLDPTVDSRTGEVRGGGGAAPGGAYGRRSGAADAMAPPYEPGTSRHHGGASHGYSHATPATMSGGAAPGPAPNTTGPHRSGLMNKLDPTVDSKPHESARYY